MNKTKKMMAGVLAAALVTSLAACGQDRPPKPTGTDCDDWDWDGMQAPIIAMITIHLTQVVTSQSKILLSKQALQSSSTYKSYATQYKSGIGNGRKVGLEAK